ncbi:MAG: prohibitin family protein [Clostridia bacterium]|nr:prohibitin family protein [Clostridia bacterium]
MKKKLVSFLVLLAVVAIAAIIILSSCLISIPTGHTGVVTTFGRVAEHTLSPGMHLKMPTQKIIVMDSRSQKKTITTQAFSSDIQQVDITCSINFSVPSDGCRELYESVGVSYYDTIMMPRLMENIKAVFANYSAERLIAVRNELSGQVLTALTEEMSAYGISVISLSIEDIDFSDAFTEAVEAKQVAEQTKLKVETEQAQQVSVEKASAERRIITAKAEAEERAILAEADAAVARIEADAKAYAIEKEAEANERLAKSLTDNLIDYMKVNQWNGSLPAITGGATPIIDTSDLIDADK